MPRILLLIAVGATLIAVLLPQVVLFEHMTDDAFISFRYAARLAAGDGLTFNPGERVEGFSNPLWTLLLGLGLRLSPFDAPDLARGLGLLCALGTIALLWAAALRLGASAAEKAALGLTGCGLVLVVPGFHVYATAGLEGPLLMVLVTAGSVLALLRRPGRSAWPAALCFGLAGITRPEGPLYGLLWFAVDRLGRIRRTRSLRPQRDDFVEGGLLVLPALAYQIFRLAYYGALLPNTFLAKPSGAFGGPLGGLPDLWPWLVSLGGPITLALLGVLFVNRFRLSPRSRRIARHTAGPIAAGLIFVLYAGGDWMPFGRFMTPVWPLVALLAATVLYDAAAWLTHDRPGIPRLAAVGLLAGAMFASAVAVWRPEVRAYRFNDDPFATLMRGEDQIAQGLWIDEHIAPGSTVAVRHIGAIAHLGDDLVIWDLNGLTDREQAEWVASGYTGGFPANPVLHRRPDVIADSSMPIAWSYVNQPDHLAWLQANYTKVHSLPHGPEGTVDIWVATDRIDDVLIR